MTLAAVGPRCPALTNLSRASGSQFLCVLPWPTCFLKNVASSYGQYVAFLLFFRSNYSLRNLMDRDYHYSQKVTAKAVYNEQNTQLY